MAIKDVIVCGGDKPILSKLEVKVKDSGTGSVKRGIGSR
jgi:hypothetical protein